ncbi:MAG TPA: hypothetical protein VF412_11125 [Bdellovibrio sp.]|uniref:hypothetical protein n=1 Tax=Bdellovibrio sp. TaxID=28201 RepID=UPI002EE89BD6
MKVAEERKSLIRNSQGMISADFLFSITLCVGISIVFFAMTFTLAMSEVVQYITFSTARAHAAAHIDPDKQLEMGNNKFKALVNTPVFKSLFATPNGAWFLVGTTQQGAAGAPDIRNGLSGSDFSETYGITPDNSALPYTGVQITFTPRILNIKIPFLGNTASDTDTGFSAKLNALIFREPSQSECLDQMKKRYDAFVQLNSGYTMGSGTTSRSYYPMEDNGC